MSVVSCPGFARVSRDLFAARCRRSSWPPRSRRSRSWRIRIRRIGAAAAAPRFTTRRSRGRPTAPSSPTRASAPTSRTSATPTARTAARLLRATSTCRRAVPTRSQPSVYYAYDSAQPGPVLPLARAGAAAQLRDRSQHGQLRLDQPVELGAVDRVHGHQRRRLPRLRRASRRQQRLAVRERRSHREHVEHARKSQSLDYVNDPAIHLLKHNPAAFVDGPSGTDRLLNFHNTLTPNANWPNGSGETDVGLRHDARDAAQHGVRRVLHRLPDPAGDAQRHRRSADRR